MAIHDAAGVTRDECISEAAKAWADTCVRQGQLTPRQAAIEAYQPGGPAVEEIEARIRARRATHGRVNVA